jgi:hypothetical protein
MKKCPCCKIEKPFSDYHRDNNKKDKVQSFCKKCSKKTNNRWRLENKEQYSEVMYKYRSSEKGFFKNRLKDAFVANPKAYRAKYVPECTKDEVTTHFYKYIKKNGRNCYYCREPWTYIVAKHVPGEKAIKQINRSKTKKNLSIDRLDNSKTYTIDNIVFCCLECNMSKRDISVALIKRLNEIIVERNL